MPFDLTKLLDVVSRRLIYHADELTALDSAIGDGDHGLNMKRGFEAVLGDLAAIAAKPLPDALRAVGTALVMKIGGASGPLYGTLFLTLGKELGASPNSADFCRALAAAVAAMKARGKSDVGQKTMLDVLAPIVDEIKTGQFDTRVIRQKARRLAEATIPLKATRGRASFLGDRSIGHMDPGARSSELIIDAVCDYFEGRT
ncbi:MAG TPA: dihydroxyacetone kinase subunit DhaL [Nitrospira sp.]|jgi:dihydroxyacetone kinase-like protein|nr:dihydroxyacetone kinase subunit DhaL [Nitrospira sp.]